MEEYLTVAEAAAVLKVTPKRVRNMICDGVFKRDVHYFRPPSLGTRFKRSALLSWIESKDQSAPEIIPLTKGVVLKIPANGLQRHS